MIYNINDSGYLAHSLEDIAKAIEQPEPVNMEQVNDALVNYTKHGAAWCRGKGSERVPPFAIR